MKIAIDISQIAYEGTGVATYTKELVRHLLMTDDENGYLLFGMSWRQNAAIAAFCQSLSAYTKVSFRILPIPQTIGNFIWNRIHRFNIERLIGSYDILHTSDWVEFPTRRKKVTTIHDLVIYKYPQTSHPSIVKTQKLRFRWVKDECDLILCDSKATYQDIVNILHVEPQRLQVVYPGIEERFAPSPKKEIDAVRKKYGLEETYILTVGTLEPRKNVAMVVSAFEQLQQHSLITSRKTPVTLAIAGKTGWGKEVQPTRNSKLLGFVPDADLTAIYSGAMCFVYASLYEGFGLPVLEAMACGCPVITSDSGSLKEVAGNAAIFIDPHDPADIARKIVQVAVDPALQQELRKKGKKNAEKYSWKKTASAVLSLYEKLHKAT